MKVKDLGRTTIFHSSVKKFSKRIILNGRSKARFNYRQSKMSNIYWIEFMASGEEEWFNSSFVIKSWERGAAWKAFILNSRSSSSGRSSSTPTNSSNSRRNSLRQFFRHRDAVDEEEDIPMSSRGWVSSASCRAVTAFLLSLLPPYEELL